MKSDYLAPQIERHIYLIRSKKVMLSHDLAMLYGVETKALNQATQRNSERFPEDFMFQLTGEEWNSLKCQTGTSNPDAGGLRSQSVTLKRGQHLKYLPSYLPARPC